MKKVSGWTGFAPMLVCHHVASNSVADHAANRSSLTGIGKLRSRDAKISLRFAFER
jgi:hypothetical protein